MEYDMYLPSCVDEIQARSLIRGWYLACLRCRASFIFLMVLAGMVNSEIWVSLPDLSQRSAGLMFSVKRLVKMVSGRLLLALRPGRSACRISNGLRAGMSAFPTVCRTKLWYICFGLGLSDIHSRCVLCFAVAKSIRGI